MKFILFILVLVLSFTCNLSNSQDIPDDAALYEAFLNWKDNYNIFYTSDEMQDKFKAWKSNLLKIASLNGDINEPDVLFSVSEDQPAALNSRTLLAADSVVVESYPSNNARFELNQYSDLTQEEFQTIYANADVSLDITAATAAALSTGAIVGIAVGGAAGVAAVGGVTAYVIKKKKSSNSNNKEEKTNNIPMKSPQQGINIFNPDVNPHHSITARAQYN